MIRLGKMAYINDTSGFGNKNMDKHGISHMYLSFLFFDFMAMQNVTINNKHNKALYPDM